MKKKTFVAILFGFGLLAASCQKDTNPEPVAGGMTINAVSDEIGTKAEMAYKYDVLWSKNDLIYVTDGTSGDEFKLSAGAGTAVGTFSQVGTALFNDEVEAFYPSTIVKQDENGAASLEWPAVQSNNQVPPIYCKKALARTETEEFRFSSLGAMLQIVLNTTDENIVLKSIEIKDGQKTMSGAFEVTDGQAVITATDKAGVTLDLGAGVPIGLTSKFFYLAIPAGEYRDLTLTFTTTDGNRCVMHSSTLPEVERNVAGRIAVTAKSFLDIRAFSVNAQGLQVRFASGNLRYEISSGNWTFFKHQYDTGNYDKEISLFSWGCKSTVRDTYNHLGGYSGASMSLDDDWGALIHDGSIWRTLTSEEWAYLLGSGDSPSQVRKGKCIAGITVCGQKDCLVIAPDFWDMDMEPLKGEYNAAEWAAAEKKGLVCLPAAGVRSGSSISDTDTGCYWSSTGTTSTSADYMVFSSGLGGQIDIESSSRFYGRSVRLVTDVK